MYADRLSTVYDDIHLARSTQNTIREFIRNHPTVYCGTHTPLGYENLEAKRVMNLDNPPATIWPSEDYYVVGKETGKYICSVCGYVYDPAEHDFPPQPNPNANGPHNALELGRRLVYHIVIK